ncbi:MAG: hypothetical protein VB934_22660 [Polyangiaceae bacterium]
MKLDLHTRDLTTGDRAPKVFESVDKARAWLKERPKNIAVLGVASHHVPKELANELRESMRPMDDEERALLDKLHEAEAAVIAKQVMERQAADAKAAAARAKTMKSADPKREMELRWSYNQDLRINDAADSREITDEARAAVDAWIAERQEWVESRGQIIGDATINVWPSDLPEGTTERIILGSFIPITA